MTDYKQGDKGRTRNGLKFKITFDERDRFTNKIMYPLHVDLTKDGESGPCDSICMTSKGEYFPHHGPHGYDLVHRFERIDSSRWTGRAS